MSDVDTIGYSSSDESIVREQAGKLFRLCDSERKGYIVKTDLGAIAELVPAKDWAEIVKQVETNAEKFISEREFVNIIKAIVVLAESNNNVGNKELIQEEIQEIHIDQPIELYDLPSVMNANGLSLADEMSSRDKIVFDDPLTEMLRQQLNEPYPYTVENNSSEHPVVKAELPTIYEHEKIDNPVYITKPQYRPIEPEVYGTAQSMRTLPPQSLADEMNELEDPSRRVYKKVDEPDLRTPDRIFKVVFVGDSAIGKTCFLHRFCHNRFKPLFNATIGVDFTVKTIPLRDRIVALQLWDTAGQERFRSITKQYFRKADGVVLMFDVTSEQSLLNVRNWIDSVRAGVDEATVMCLVGNKVDLFGQDSSRNAVYRAGRRLADEFGMPFFETSAFTGYGINECMRAMAERLQKREEDHLEEALKLEMEPTAKKRSWCCI